MPAETFRVGELARRTGVSVRALHHYDAIGLLSPSRRSESRYRLYTASDIVRLQQITSLRQLGFSLREIHGLLERRDLSPSQVIEMHSARLEDRIALQQGLLERLRMLAHRLEGGDEVSVDEFLDTIEEISMAENVEKYYTPEQLAELRHRSEKIGPERIREVEQEWPRLIANVRAEMNQGTDPADPRVQALAERWRTLIAEFTGGNTGITQSLQRMYDSDPDMAARTGMDSDLRAYAGRMLSGPSAPRS